MNFKLAFEEAVESAGQWLLVTVFNSSVSDGSGINQVKFRMQCKNDVSCLRMILRASYRMLSCLTINVVWQCRLQDGL